MLLPKFDFHEPASVRDACQIMATYGVKAKLLAGGTDLLVNMKKKTISPEHIVCLSKIEVMHGVEAKQKQIIIGGRFTVAELIENSIVKEKLSALSAGAMALGSPLVRNRATIGGNISSARPAADLPPSLMAYGAFLVLESTNGKREIPLKKFFIGPGFTEMGPNEILTRIIIPIPANGEGAGYLNMGIRHGHDCNVVNVASFLALNPKDETIQNARIIMGSVGPTPLRATTAESVLKGEKPSKNGFLKAAEAARQDCKPIDDFRGSASYRKAMVGVLTKRTLDIAYDQAVRS